MTSNIDIMLYVTDVHEHSLFWQNLGLTEVGQMDLGESTQITLATKDETYRLCLFDIEFIKKMSPEVAAMKPSLMFFTDDFDGFIENAVKSDVQMMPERAQFGARTRAFSDPDGNFFAISDKRN